jgi:hypothetical protein
VSHVADLFFRKVVRLIWSAKNHCFRPWCEVHELFLEDFVGQTWDKVIVFNKFSPTNWWTNGGGESHTPCCCEQ